jgi:hypothetical protein
MSAKIKTYLYCGMIVALAGALVFLLAAFLQLQRAEAQNQTPVLPALPGQSSSDLLEVIPNPPQVSEPTELRVTLFNNNGSEVIRYAQFFWSASGIGQELHLIGQRIQFSLPPHAAGSASAFWVPPTEGPFCFYVSIFDSSSATQPLATYQNNVIFRGHPDPSGPRYVEAIPIPLRNPLAGQATFALSVDIPPDAADWVANPDPPQVVLNPGQNILAHAVFTYTGGSQLPPGGTVVFGFKAAVNSQPVGAVDILYGPPLRLHMRPDPPFAESEINVTPYPISPGEPAEICAEVRNVTNQPRDAQVYFRAAPFGIGIDSQLVAPPQSVFVPGRGMVRPCINWVASSGGQFSFEVQVETPGFPMLVSSLRVLDVSELLLPGTSSQLHFPVRNPFSYPVTITLALDPLQPWPMAIDTPVLVNMLTQETRLVTLTVTVPPGIAMPPDGTPVADVQAFAGTDPLTWQSIGGFRKIYRPPVPIHQPADPIYAESEITISPYPPKEREPTEICVDIRNPTNITQTMTVDFNVANFGIGLTFHAIARPIAVSMPANSMKKVCVTWVPPFGGDFGVEVGIQVPEHERVYSQRVIDVGEILLPNNPSHFEFVVSNPYTFPITATLGATRYLPQWEVTFNPQALYLLPGTASQVEMVVNPVQRPGDPEPVQGQPVIDVEAYYQGNGEHDLLGGFRKLFFPPVPVHLPEEPPYAESEINIMPYPPLAGEPTDLAFEARNPTTATQQISVTFEVSNLGIGLEFTPINVVRMNLPPQGMARAHTSWVPPVSGEFCVRVKVQAQYFTEPFYSARNVSIVVLPEPYGKPEIFQFVIGDNGDTNRPLTITLGLRDYLPDWQVVLKQNKVVLAPGQAFATDVLTITPPVNPANLPVDGGPIADVSAYVNGDLIGGIRKVWRPPVPLGQLGEPGYAESEIVIDPYPPLAGHPTSFSAQVRNNSDHTQNISLRFGWADFGFGIPFSSVGVVPTQTVLSLGAQMTATVAAQWTPPHSGDFCVQILLNNPETKQEIRSQRNVHVEQVPEKTCTPFTKEFLLQNSTALTVTVSIGASSINLPAGWTWSADPTEAILLPYESITVTLTITPPCALNAQGNLVLAAPLPASDTPATVQVEGYDQNGKLLGGVELQLVEVPKNIYYLPLISRKTGP